MDSDVNLDGPAYSPGHVLVAWEMLRILKDEMKDDDPFKAAEPVVRNLDEWARDTSHILPSIDRLKTLAEAFAPRESVETAAAITELVGGLNERDAQVLWSRVDAYAATLILPAMLAGLWAGANITAEAGGGTLDPIPSTNDGWLIAKNMVRVSLARMRARH